MAGPLHSRGTDLVPKHEAQATGLAGHSTNYQPHGENSQTLVLVQRKLHQAGMETAD